MTTRTLNYSAWGLGAATVLLALIAWAMPIINSPKLFTSLYNLFPILGLVAFSLMWTHYVLGALRRYYKLPSSALHRYSQITGYAVLVAILLHPGLFFLQLYLDGYGLPPASYMTVYPIGTLQLGMVGLGTIALLAFLSFELRRWFKQRSWWKYVEYFNVVAMGMIFLHGLVLGGELMGGWYLVVWYAYGISLLAAVCYTAYAQRASSNHETKD